MTDKYKEFYQNSMIGHLGIVFLETENKESVVAKMPVNERTAQPFGVLHGGASIALAESVAGHGSILLGGDDYQPVGMQVSANHISTVRLGEVVIAKGKLLHKGRSSHVWNVDIMTENDTLVSTIRVVNFLLKKEK